MGLRKVVPTLAVVAALAGCSDDECDLDQQTRDLARAGLDDCGVAEGANVVRAEECAVSAHMMGQYFRVIRETSDGLEALVRGDGGTYYLVRQQDVGDPIEQASCDGAVVVTDGTVERVECDQPSDFEIVCE